jgi:glycosyltransferase involved in cell wall biosynthesis
MGQVTDAERPHVSVVIPALNEARNIAHVLATLPPDTFEVILVDGGSTDGTVEAARHARPDIRVIHQAGSGKGDALAAGMHACIGDAIVLIDGDGSTDGAEIPRFVDALLGGADLAKGSRFLPGGGSEDISLLRRAGNAFFCALVNLLFGTRYSDLCYGFNAGWRTSFERIPLDCRGFEVETVLGIRAAVCGLSVTEVPSLERPRLYGSSNLRTWRDGWRVLRAIARERRRARRLLLGEDGAVAASPRVLA